MERVAQKSLRWQSKAILLIVVPWTVANVFLQAHWWWLQVPVVAYETLGISGIFGLIVWRLKAGTPAAAATGAAITASLMFGTARPPYAWSWLHGELMPLLAVFLLTFVATKVGRRKKETLGTGESKQGRNAAQVAANLGVAAIVSSIEPLTSSLAVDRSFTFGAILALAALAEAAADTVSSEIGQVFGGTPRLLTSFRKVEAGTDGAVTLVGTLAGVVAAAVVAWIGIVRFASDWIIDSNGPGASVGIFFFLLCTGGGISGLVFDSLLGATAERRGWLNNDAVNFLSTLSAPVFYLIYLIMYGLLFPRMRY